MSIQSSSASSIKTEDAQSSSKSSSEKSGGQSMSNLEEDRYQKGSSEPVDYVESENHEDMVKDTSKDVLNAHAFIEIGEILRHTPNIQISNTGKKIELNFSNLSADM